MTTDVSIPENLWDEDEEAVIASWLASNGATVGPGSLLAEIMVEKAQYEITAPAQGTLRILKLEDEVVRKGDVIARIET